jgi:hypothetical protein
MREERHPSGVEHQRSPGLIDLLEEVDREVPLKGRRWVIGHINVLSPHDIERIVRMGLVVTPHTNSNSRKTTPGRQSCRRKSGRGTRRCATFSMPE